MVLRAWMALHSTEPRIRGSCDASRGVASEALKVRSGWLPRHSRRCGVLTRRGREASRSRPVSRRRLLSREHRQHSSPKLSIRRRLRLVTRHMRRELQGRRLLPRSRNSSVQGRNRLTASGLAPDLPQPATAQRQPAHVFEWAEMVILQAARSLFVHPR